MLRLLLIVISIFAISSVYAKPNLGNYLDIGSSDINGSDDEKVRIYRDNKNSKKWYVTPAKTVLGGKSNLEDKSNLEGKSNPGYSLDLMRYKGRKGTGDADKFWVKSVLHLELQKSYEKKAFSNLRKKLKKEGHKVLSLKELPSVGSRLRILMGGFDGSWSGYSKWSGKSIAVSLNDNMAQILWDSAEKQQQLLSIEVQTVVKGVRKKKVDGKDKWVKEEITLSETIPLELNASQSPDRFRRTDLDANIDFGYTGLEVFCFDFLEGNYPELYAVLVDIKFETEERDLIKQLRFDMDSEYRYRVDFGIAKSMDKPYKVRLTYIDKDGEKIEMPWFKKHGELMLDVTRYK